MVELTATIKLEWPKSRPPKAGSEAAAGILTRKVMGAEHYIRGGHVKHDDTGSLETGTSLSMTTGPSLIGIFGRRKTVETNEHVRANHGLYSCSLS